MTITAQRVRAILQARAEVDMAAWRLTDVIADAASAGATWDEVWEAYRNADGHPIEVRFSDGSCTMINGPVEATRAFDHHTFGSRTSMHRWLKSSVNARVAEFARAAREDGDAV